MSRSARSAASIWSSAFPVRPPAPDVELVRVFTGENAGQTAVAISLLEGEAIDYLVRGEGLQELLAWGSFAAGYNYLVGPPEFWVRADDADRARELLEGLAASAPEHTSPSDENREP